MTKTRIAAIATTLVLGAAPIASAQAFERPTRYTGFTPYAVETTGAIEARRGAAFRSPDTCPMSSAAEGNAN